MRKALGQGMEVYIYSPFPPIRSWPHPFPPLNLPFISSLPSSCLPGLSLLFPLALPLTSRSSRFMTSPLRVIRYHLLALILLSLSSVSSIPVSGSPMSPTSSLPLVTPSPSIKSFYLSLTTCHLRLHSSYLSFPFQH